MQPLKNIANLCLLHLMQIDDHQKKSNTNFNLEYFTHTFGIEKTERERVSYLIQDSIFFTNK